MQSTLPQSGIETGLAAAPAQPFSKTLAGQATLVVAASAFVALCAHVTVPLPFTLVPLSLVTFAVLLVGLALGPVAAFSAMVLYLIEGASGLPVFSPHGPGGLLQLFGPTGGFLLSYPLAAATAGALARTAGTRRARFLSASLAAAVASVFFFLFGATWYAHQLHLSASAALYTAVLPFIPGEIVKVAAAAGIFSAGRISMRS